MRLADNKSNTGDDPPRVAQVSRGNKDLYIPQSLLLATFFIVPAMQLTLDSFQRQFVMRRTEGPTPSIFVADDVGNWQLLTHPELRRLRVYDRDGTQLGWLLGEAIDVTDQTIVSQDIRLETVGSDKSAVFPIIARKVKEWAGWYLLVLAHPSLNCVMTDCAAALPCFLDETTGTIASSPALIMGIDAYNRALRTDLLDAVNIDGYGWLPFGVTAIPHIKRVLPNHRLNLGDLKVERFWPTAPITVDTDYGRLIEAIVRSAKSVINAVVEPNGLLLPLTAGRDSRMLLALSRANVSRLRAFTLINPLAKVDYKIARQLATITGMPHDAIPRIKSNDEERQAWLIRTGHVTGDKNPHHFNTLRSLDLRRAVLAGHGGALARAIYWRKGDRIDGDVNATSLLRRLDMPQHPTLVEAAKRWLQSVDQFDLLMKLDLAYIEQRLGCWAAAPPFGPDFIYRDFWPLVQRGVFEPTLALPHEFRRDRKLPREIIAREWPDLLRLPINRDTGLDRYVTLAKKVTDPVRIRRKLRRLMG